MTGASNEYNSNEMLPYCLILYNLQTTLSFTFTTGLDTSQSFGV